MLRAELRYAVGVAAILVIIAAAMWLSWLIGRANHASAFEITVQFFVLACALGAFATVVWAYFGGVPATVEARFGPRLLTISTLVACGFAVYTAASVMRSGGSNGAGHHPVLTIVFAVANAGFALRMWPRRTT